MPKSDKKKAKKDAGAAGGGAEGQPAGAPGNELNTMFKHHTGSYNLYAEEFWQPRVSEEIGGMNQAAFEKGVEKEAKQFGGDGAAQIDPQQLRFFMPRHGRTAHRALEQKHVARSAFHNPGVFGRMFPTLPSIQFTDVSLENLAKAMGSPSGGEDNPNIFSGFTFLGQFIDHDITFDPTSSLEKQNDPEAIQNFRTPVLELDSVYGSGPATQPFLYDADPANAGKLLIGRDADGRPNDLPRNSQGTALLGDPRNDENLIVSQLHLTFLKFHNKVLDHLKAKGAEGGVAVPPEFIFEETQRVVRWHYQWIVVNEFLRKTLGEALWSRLVKPEGGGKDGKGKEGKEVPPGTTVGQDPIGNVLDGTLKFYRWKGEPFIPVEFAVAAYRFGHSQIRPGYRINDGFGDSIFPGLFVRANLTADNVLKAGRAVDWSKFFDLGAAGAQPGKQIDEHLSSPLLNLPGVATIPSLPERNLKRGNTFSLPWGQRVAAAIGAQPLTDDQLAINGTKLTDMGFPAERAPLWYYILREAAVEAGGAHLGTVGGTIVGEVFLGLLKGDFKSYFNQDPLWKPFLPAANAGDFKIADLIRFATT
ncbi:MAG: heme peroxidase family protein [Acidobacteriota bacterium]|nr:heme peroxidase family protein [Acidobacteriota bacterium]